jgi:hypothetical protein
MLNSSENKNFCLGKLIKEMATKSKSESTLKLPFPHFSQQQQKQIRKG